MRNYTDRLRELREDRDLAQKQVAAVLGINQPMYSRYERGVRSLPIEHLIALCKYYHVSADYILCLKDDSGFFTTHP